MLRGLLARLRGGTDAEDEESADDEGRGFIPSRLDASVLYAHGMGDTHAEREIISLQEKDRLVEEQRRRRESQ